MSAHSASDSAAAIDFDARRFFGPNLAENCGLHFTARPAAASRPVWLLRLGADAPQGLPAAAGRRAFSLYSLCCRKNLVHEQN